MERNEQLSSGRRASRPKQDRRRVERACDTCRRRKERCNGARPVCSNCKNALRSCTYLAEIKRRGLPEGWVRGLEKFWSIAMLQHPDLETDILQAVSKAIATPQDSLLSTMWTDDVHDQGLLGRWRSCRLAQELEDYLSQLDGLPQKSITSFEPTDGIGLQISQHSTTPDISHTSEQNSQIEADPQFQHTSIVSAMTEVPNLGQLLPADTSNKIDSYFNFTQVWLPILQKHEIFKTYHTWSSNYATTTSGDRACLLAILAHETSITNQPQRAPMSQDPNCKADAPYQHFIDSVQTHLPPARADYEISHAQTLLVLALTKLQNNDPEGAWLCVGTGLRIALLQHKGLLERSPTSGSLKPHDSDRLQRVISGGFVLDGLLSAWLQTTPQLGIDELQTISCLEEDGIDEWSSFPQSLTGCEGSNPSPARSISTFNRVIQATKFFVTAYAPSNSSPDAETQITAGIRDISAWESSLPMAQNWKSALRETQAIPPHFLTFHLLHLATLFKLSLSMMQLNQCEISNAGEIGIIHEGFVQLLYRHARDLKPEKILPIWPSIIGSHLRSLLELCVTNTNIGLTVGLPESLGMMSYVFQGWSCQNRLGEQIDQLRAILTTSSTITRSEYGTDRTGSGSAYPLLGGNIASNIGASEFNLNTMSPSPTNSPAPFTVQSQKLPNISSANPLSGTGYTGISEESDIDITNFMTVDAMIWDEPWKQSFQHLGFTDAENTESGLQEFFSSM